MRVCVVGMGRVGLPVAVGLASVGHAVTGVDVEGARVASLAAGRAPFYELGVETLLTSGLTSGRLRFAEPRPEAGDGADALVLAIPVPSPLSAPAAASAAATAASPAAATAALAAAPLVGAVAAVVEPAARHLPIVVIKSTVPVGTGDAVEAALREGTGRAWDVVSNPEFLSEGSAVSDFLHPDRVVIGAASADAAQLVRSLYAWVDCPVVVTDRRTAELTKYVTNAYLATRISFMNQVSDLCEALGIDVSQVATGLGLDRRVGRHFLKPGLGYGGSCLPRNAQELSELFVRHGVDPSIIDAAQAVNRGRRERMLAMVRSRLGDVAGSRVAVWGLAFKPGTDDLRDAPALTIVPALVREAAEVRVYDPALRDAASRWFAGVVACRDALEAADGAHAVVLVTDWPEFATVSLEALRQRMAGRVLVDGRGQLDARRAAGLGFDYCSLGGRGIDVGRGQATGSARVCGLPG